MVFVFSLLCGLVLAFALVRLGGLWFGFWARTARGSARIARWAGGVWIAVLALVLWLVPSPVFVLLGLVALPLLLAAFSRTQAAFDRRRMDDSGLAYFHALQGLVQSGLGFSTALFRLADAHPTPFAKAMARTLGDFEDGRAMEDCLERLRRRIPSRLAGACLRGLQTAYRQGLPVAPLLDKMIPLLESEQESARRVADLRRSALAQAAVAFAVPWVLVACFHFCAGDSVGGWFSTPSGRAWVAGALAVEGGGVWALWRIGSFY